MSVLHCTVKVVKPGTMKNGNPYQRLCLEKPDGSEEWMPNFTGKMVNVGDKLIAEIKEGRYSAEYGQQYLIDDFVLDGEANTQQTTQRPAEAGSGGNTEQYDREKYKQLSIMCCSAFGHILSGGDWDMDSAKAAFKVASFWDKKIRAYMGGLDLDAMKGNLADDVQDAVSADSAEVAGPEHTSQPDDPGFDDDLPF